MVDLDIVVFGGEGKMMVIKDGFLVKGFFGGFIELSVEDEVIVKEMMGECVDFFVVMLIKVDW